MLLQFLDDTVALNARDPRKGISEPRRAAIELFHRKVFHRVYDFVAIHVLQCYAAVGRVETFQRIMIDRADRDNAEAAHRRFHTRQVQ